VKQPYFGVSLKPAEYARDMVKRLGFKEPHIEWVDNLLDHLGLTKRLYSGAHFFSDQPEIEIYQSDEREKKLFEVDLDLRVYPTRRKQRRPVEAALYGHTVFIDGDFPLERQRLSTCHEVGHYCLPWHEDLAFFREGCVVEPPERKWYESEAHQFAADVLMPPPFFREDMGSLPFGLESIERLSERYLTSLEATARHYVDLSLRSCALVIVEALPHGATTQNAAGLQVRYCHKSHSFPHFIRSGTEVASESPIAQSSLGWSGLTITDEVPGWVFGLRPERRLILHCRSWGKEGDVLVLVEERQGYQPRLF